MSRYEVSWIISDIEPMTDDGTDPITSVLLQAFADMRDVVEGQHFAPSMVVVRDQNGFVGAYDLVDLFHENLTDSL